MKRAQTAVPKKKQKKSRSELYLANVKHFGPEPEYDGAEMGMADKARCLTWYSNMCSVSEAREYAELYVEKWCPSLSGKLNEVSDTSFPLTASWLARMAERGAHTEETTHRFIKKSFEDAVRKYAGRVEERVDSELVSTA